MKQSKLPPSFVPPPNLGGGIDGGGIKILEEKLAQLREKLLFLENDGREKIKEQRLRNDMGDDYRENEGAKMTMHDHDILQIRILGLKKEILELKKKIISNRQGRF